MTRAMLLANVVETAERHWEENTPPPGVRPADPACSRSWSFGALQTTTTAS